MIAMKILLVFIYQGELRGLRDSQVKNICNDIVYFAATLIKQSNNNIKRQWLEKVFNKYTKNKTRWGYQLLIVDKHCNYVNLSFVNYIKKYQIIVFILLPYFTHQLQLLDIRLYCGLIKLTQKSYQI